MLKVTGWACGDGVESGGRASVRLGLPARWESSMANGPVDGYTVNELADAYAAMESMVQAPHFAQDQQGLVDAVTAHVAGADCASITELRCGAFVTLAASAQAARDADALQYDLGSGPCVDAITQGCVVAPIDLRSDPRWPHFGTKAADRFGFHSMLSLRLLTDVPDCAYGLNIYGARVHAFDDRGGPVRALGGHVRVVRRAVLGQPDHEPGDDPQPREGTAVEPPDRDRRRYPHGQLPAHARAEF